MTTFVQTVNPCPFGFFSADPAFISDADGMATFVLRRLGNDVLAVELSKKEIWACFEEATLEYGRLVNEMRAQSELINVLGMPTGSTDLTNTYLRPTLEYLFRLADPYATAAGVGGNYDATLGYINLQPGVQDYSLYDDLYNAETGASSVVAGVDAVTTTLQVTSAKPFADFTPPFVVSVDANNLNAPMEAMRVNSVDVTGTVFSVTRGVNGTTAVAHNGNAPVNMLMYNTQPNAEHGKITIQEVFHFEPFAAQQFLLNASNVTNFLASNFNYESYVNSTIFYVLPVFEDVLRRQMLETAFRVRRSNYSWEIIGSKLRIFPIPVSDSQFGKLYVKVFNGQMNSLNSSIGGNQGGDDTIYGINGPANAPYSIVMYSNITSPGRQWIREFTLALCKEVLSLTRGKFSSLPIPGNDVTLNHEQLMTQSREDQTRLRDKLVEWLANFTSAKLLEQQASVATSMQLLLKSIPFPNGGCIRIF
jgi:hypothetical protein